MSRSSSRTGFSMIELVVIVLVLGFASTVLLAQLGRSREQENRAKCGNNLRQIGHAMFMYERDNKAFPRGPFDPAKPLTAGTKGKNTGDVFGGDVAGNDCSVALFLLMREDLPANYLVCPGGNCEADRLDGKTPFERNNFTTLASPANGGRGNLGYSIQCAYPLNKASSFQWRAGGAIDGEFPVAADLNPGISKDGEDNVVIAKVDGKSVRAGNSRNHLKDGQNVLFGDGHVEWKDTPLCGKGGDNIYTYGPGQQGKCDGALNGGPQDATDSYLLPAYNDWAGK